MKTSAWIKVVVAVGAALVTTGCAAATGGDGAKTGGAMRVNEIGCQASDNSLSQCHSGRGQ